MKELAELSNRVLDSKDEDEKDKQQRNLVGRKTTGSLAKDKR